MGFLYLYLYLLQNIKRETLRSLIQRYFSAVWKEYFTRGYNASKTSSKALMYTFISYRNFQTSMVNCRTPTQERGEVKYSKLQATTFF
jgi:hypothetical protein